MSINDTLSATRYQAIEARRQRNNRTVIIDFQSCCFESKHQNRRDETASLLIIIYFAKTKASHFVISAIVHSTKK